MPLKGKQLVGILLQNILEGPQYHPQPHPLHSTPGKNPHAMEEMGELDQLEERLRDIEGGEDYAFASLEELFLVPKHGHSQVQGAGLWQVQGDYLLQEPSKDIFSEDGGIRKRWETADTFFLRKSY